MEQRGESAPETVWNGGETREREREIHRSWTIANAWTVRFAPRGKDDPLSSAGFSSANSRAPRQITINRR